jgi:hypothetical protein
MSIPMSVDSDRLRQVYTISGHCSATDILTGGMSRGFWEPVLIWSASQFQEENGLFFLAATKYRQAPTKAKMDYIYRHFVGHGKTLADRAINLPSAARERTFELVTGAQTKHFHGGCRMDAFDEAMSGLRGYLMADINQRFGQALKSPEGTTYRMLAGQNIKLNKELDEMARLGLNL